MTHSAAQPRLGRLGGCAAALGMSAVLAACGLAGSSAPGKLQGAASEARQPWAQPVRQAVCGQTDKVETGLQGQVPRRDIASGRARLGYNCNLEMVGHWPGDGASWQHAWYDDCAYYGTKSDASRAHQGVVVVDASLRDNPRAANYLTETPMIDPWESLKVHQQRGLLAAVDGLGGGGGPDFVVYDLKGDCRAPQLLFDGPMGQTSGHEGNWAEDGKTYYGSNGTYNAFNVDDPSAPQFMLAWQPPSGTHGLSTSADGNIGYFSHNQFTTQPAANNFNGVSLVDLSDIQSRKPDPGIRVVSELLWNDGSAGAQHSLTIKIAGKPYIVFVDEFGIGKSCAEGLAPFSFARIIDVADAKNPQLVAKLMLETHDGANCPVVMADYPAQVLFGYDAHYCSADDPQNATALACGYFNSGIRVFDIRDPYFPREAAYFIPPAKTEQEEQKLKGSQRTTYAPGAVTPDWCSAQVRFRKHADGSGELWTTCQDNGFMILKFTNGAWPFTD